MKTLEPIGGMEIIGLTLYLKESGTLVFGDTHLGYEEELRSLGIPVPRQQYKEAVEHLSKVFSFLEEGGKRLSRIVINGDLKHEFGRISSQEWSEVLSFLDYLKGCCPDIVLVKGNHDTILGPLAGRKGLEIVDHLYLEKEDIFICHGHRLMDERDAKTIIIGHEHPAFKVSDGVRTEKVKCFLVGKGKKNLIVMPSLSYSTEGSDVAAEASLSPYMEQISGEADVYGVEGTDVLCFGKLKDVSGE